MKLSQFITAMFLGGAAIASEPIRLTVYTEADGATSDAALPRAMATASWVLRPGNIEIEWRLGRRRSIDEVQLSLQAVTSPYECPGALGRTSLGRGHKRIVIYHDRITFRVRNGLDVPVVTGYAMAHELVHVVQNSSRHSPRGLMQRCWGVGDLWDIVHRRVALEPEDLRAISLTQNKYLTAN